MVASWTNQEGRFSLKNCSSAELYDKLSLVSAFFESNNLGPGCPSVDLNQSALQGIRPKGPIIHVAYRHGIRLRGKISGLETASRPGLTQILRQRGLMGSPWGIAWPAGRTSLWVWLSNWRKRVWFIQTAWRTLANWGARLSLFITSVVTTGRMVSKAWVQSREAIQPLGWVANLSWMTSMRDSVPTASFP